MLNKNMFNNKKGAFGTVGAIIVLLFILILGLAIFFGDSGLLQDGLNQFNIVVQNTFGLADSASTFVNDDVEASFKKLHQVLTEEHGKDTKGCLLNSYFPVVWDRYSYSFTNTETGVEMGLVTEDGVAMYSDTVEGVKICGVYGKANVRNFNNLYIVEASKGKPVQGKPYSSFTNIVIGKKGYQMDSEKTNYGSFYLFKYDKNTICVIPEEDNWVWNNYQGVKKSDVNKIDNMQTSLKRCSSVLK
jgi:hypothetical protein